MKIFRAALFLSPVIFLFNACAVSKNPQRKYFRGLQRGTVQEDTSFVYHLPYATGKKHLLAQGYFSRLSHRESVALDFKMKRGTLVTAARGGIVVRIKQDGDRGGWNRKFRPYGNLIVIEHADGSRAGYWHLQHNSVRVNAGDTVTQD